MSKDPGPSEFPRRGLIVVTVLYLLFLFAWCATHGGVRDFWDSSIDSAVSRCAVYRRCCRPSCRFAEAI
jgi:hypothetical protein